MKYFSSILVALLSLAAYQPAQADIPDIFTIQGVLLDAGGIPIAGSKDYLINFYDAEADGNFLQQRAGATELSAAGRFSIPIEALPTNVLDATEVWYQLSIDTAGDGVDGGDQFPGRVRLLSVPYALRAGDADSLGGQPASDFSTSNNVWKTSGNNASSGDYLGTTNLNALELRANNLPALRLIPKFNGPNVIAGHEGNSADPSITDGGTISGGGFPGFPNRVVNDHSTVGGGLGNAAVGGKSTIAGGDRNEGTGEFSFIGGGQRNETIGRWSSVSGGGFNRAQGDLAAVGGGNANSAIGDDSFVGGGINNRADGQRSTIGGGLGNEAAAFAAVAGGSRNEASGEVSSIGGGEGNSALGIYTAVAGGRNNRATGSYSFVGGGRDNLAENDFSGVASGQLNRATGSTAFVGGGDRNDAGGMNSFVGGGQQNRALGGTDSVVGGFRNVATGGGAHIGGGDDNLASGVRSFIGAGSDNRSGGFGSVVAGGAENIAFGSCSFIGSGENNTSGGSHAAVGGGLANSSSGAQSTVSGGQINAAIGPGASIGGGGFNRAAGLHNTIAGGSDNETDGNFSTIPGGSLNEATGSYSFAAGHRAKAFNQGAFVWADSQNENVTSTADDQFLVRAQGGVHLTIRPDGSGLRILSAGDTDEDPPNLIGGDDGNTIGPDVHGAVIAGGGGESGVAKGTSQEPNQVWDLWGTIGGGSGNQVGSEAKGAPTGVYGTVAGGRRNEALGGYSMIPGGRRNTAGGRYSFAAGNNAKALQEGCFVWADSQATDFESTADDQFLIRAQGGVGINRTTLTNAFEVEGNASKTAAGDWLANSDRRIKTEVEEIEDALDTINQLRPVKYKYTEAYKRDHPSIGDHGYYNYIAQEYAEVFPESVKEDAVGLLLMDGHNANVVAVKAIQELSDTVERQEELIERLETRIRDLENGRR